MIIILDFFTLRPFLKSSYERYKVRLTAILGITQSSGICYVICSQKSLQTQVFGQRLHERFCTPNVTVLLRFCTFSVISCHPVQNECPGQIFACGHDVLQHSVVTDIDIDALLLDLLRLFLKKPPSNRALNLRKTASGASPNDDK
jgi:hypothetical protein